MEFLEVFKNGIFIHGINLLLVFAPAVICETNCDIKHQGSYVEYKDILDIGIDDKCDGTEFYLLIQIKHTPQIILSYTDKDKRDHEYAYLGHMLIEYMKRNSEQRFAQI